MLAAMDGRAGRAAQPLEPGMHRRQDQIEQAAAAAASHIERWFDHLNRPNTSELAKAKLALDRAVELATTR
jgi:hypothetical protein